MHCVLVRQWVGHPRDVSGWGVHVTLPHSVRYAGAHVTRSGFLCPTCAHLSRDLSLLESGLDKSYLLRQLARSDSE